MSNETPPPLHMRRIDDCQNMRRYYSLNIQPTLFGDVSLIRHWGRIGTAGQSMIETFSNEAQASLVCERLSKIKCAKGYLETL